MSDTLHIRPTTGLFPFSVFEYQKGYVKEFADLDRLPCDCVYVRGFPTREAAQTFIDNGAP